MTEEVIDDEELLVFKRFPTEKQDQVRALVNYATLMGLTGKDLVSIGGKLDRLKAARERKHQEAVLDGMLEKVSPIGKDKKDYRNQIDPRRFDYTDGSGRKWRVEGLDWHGARVTSDSGVTKRVTLGSHYAVSGRNKFHLKQFLLHVYHGEIQLNF